MPYYAFSGQILLDSRLHQTGDLVSVFALLYRKGGVARQAWATFPPEDRPDFHLFPTQADLQDLHVSEFKLGEEENLDLRRSSDFELGRRAPPSLGDVLQLLDF